jgi:hypothetical protein
VARQPRRGGQDDAFGAEDADDGEWRCHGVGAMTMLRRLAD